MPPSGHAAMVGLRDVLRWWRSKEVCLHSLPIRKWGRNSEFRPDLHPSRALFFCSYWETQWGLCVWRGDNCWSDRVSDSGGCGCHILWAFHRQSETPGPHFQVRLCSELPGHIPQPCQVRGLWVLVMSWELWGLCSLLCVLISHHCMYLFELQLCRYLCPPENKGLKTEYISPGLSTMPSS